VGAIVLGFGVALFEGVAWSLLWSVVQRSALHAAILGLFTVLTLNMVAAQTVVLWDPTALAPTAPLRLALAFGALALSCVVFTRAPRPERTAPATIRAPSVAPRRSRWGEVLALVCRLVWETARESRRTWLLLTGAALGLPAAAWLELRHNNALTWTTVMGILAVLLGGVSVFGAANRTRSYRFLAQHGVRPGAVWTVKLLVWSVVLASLLIVPLMMSILIASRVVSSHNLGEVLAALLFGFISLVLAISDIFVIGLFCGQVLKQNVTAWVVACAAFILLVVPQLWLASIGMIPPWIAVLFPILVLGVSRAWTGDWMNDLRGPARWLRLGTMVGLAAVLLVASYIGYRGWGVPLIDPPIALTAVPTPTPLAPDQDAAPDYAQILSKSPPFRPGATWSNSEEAWVIAEPWNPQRLDLHAMWAVAREQVAQLRRAAARPEARFTPRAAADSRIDPHIHDLWRAIDLLGLDSAERSSRGDLAGAWDDLTAAFRMAAQVSRAGALDELGIALRQRAQVLQWALVWAADPHQKPAQLRSALAEFHTLPPRASFADCLRAEYALIARSSGRIQGVPRLIPYGPTHTLFGSIDRVQMSSLLLAPAWEHERIRRVLPIWLAEQLEVERLEPWERIVKGTADTFDAGYWKRCVDVPVTRGRAAMVIRGSDVLHDLTTTLLVGEFWWSAWDVLPARDEESVLSRTFEQMAALRIWQLEHAGQYPDTLAALVPGLLPSLPADPYSGMPFRYRRAEGQTVAPLGHSGLVARPVSAATEPTLPGQWLLYSVGPDGRDDGAKREYEPFTDGTDLIFPLPEDV
jgi:hypothetical protein